MLIICAAEAESHLDGPADGRVMRREGDVKTAPLSPSFETNSGVREANKRSAGVSTPGDWPIRKSGQIGPHSDPPTPFRVAGMLEDVSSAVRVWLLFMAASCQTLKVGRKSVIGHPGRRAPTLRCSSSVVHAGGQSRQQGEPFLTLRPSGSSFRRTGRVNAHRLMSVCHEVLGMDAPVWNDVQPPTPGISQGVIEWLIAVQAMHAALPPRQSSCSARSGIVGCMAPTQSTSAHVRKGFMLVVCSTAQDEDIERGTHVEGLSTVCADCSAEGGVLGAHPSGSGKAIRESR